MSDIVSESRFNMWRAVVAMIHADDVVQPHEIHFVLENTRGVPFTDEQRATLNQDIHSAADIQDLFQKITSPKDKEDFFHLARAISWSDGDFDERERSILLKMGRLAVRRQDEDLLRDSVRNFQDVYVDRKKTASDQNLFGVIRGLLKRAGRG